MSDKTEGFNQFELDFIHHLEAIAMACHEITEDKGFWKDRDLVINLPSATGFTVARRELFIKAEMIALMHSELSELLEGLRKSPGGFKDEHCPDFSNEVVELADLLIRVFDYARAFRLPLGAAIIAKMHYNATRPYKHNKEA